ncbi:MAG: DUF2147 domain-containing protein [Bacteroidales bacterium]|jgi:uncharacterized protein (DUF2147 family)|nr:DUF2147 domain-containing protein [Bacteroidales bacterium]
MLQKLWIFSLLIFFATHSFSQIDKIVGSWKTIDDKTGETKSIVRIYKATDNKYYGKIEKIFEYEDAKCIKCEGKDKDQPIVGLVIIRGMIEKKGKLDGGSVLDPESGKTYYGSISYDAEKDQLKLRGALDKFGIAGRNQYWIRVK